MAAPTSASHASASGGLGRDAPDVLATSRTTHALYDTLKPIWELLADVAEGSGGFADGTALVPHPREYLDHSRRVQETDPETGQLRWVTRQNDNPTQPTKKLIERRRLARYENWADTILTLIAGGLFRKAPTRRAGAQQDENAAPHPYMAWCQNVDGHGTSMDAYLQREWRASAVFGHTFHVLDRPVNQGETAADAPPFYLRSYQPLDVVDWLTDDMGFLVAIRALEIVPRAGFSEKAGVQEREITADGWRVYDVVRTQAGRGRKARIEESLRQANEGEHDFAGQLPVVVLKAKARPLQLIVGQSVLGDPYIHIDDYNLSSETRELLRKQTFSVLNVPLGVSAQGGTAMSLQEAQALMGQSTGTNNVLFTPLEAQYISADTANITAYQSEQDRVRRTMFRLAGLPWESDSRQVEAAESRRIKREDLNQTLALYADHLEQADKAIARLWFQGTYGARWQDEWTKAQVVIDWPETFDSEVLDDLLDRAAKALAQVPTKTFVAEVRKEIAQKVLPAMPAEKRQAINAEIEAALTPQEQREQDMAQRMERLAASGFGGGAA